MNIKIDDFIVTLQRKRIKNINLRIKSSGEVQVSAPLRTPIHIIEDFLLSKLSWIKKHHARLLQINQHMPTSFITGTYFHYLGKKYSLKVYENDSKTFIQIKNQEIQLHVLPETSQSAQQLLIQDWYHDQMQKILTPLLEKWQSIMQVSINKLTIKNMKSRWGSCHHVKKHISLNLRLIEKPLICLEYVLVHELVHLFEPSHNNRFYKFMDYYLPKWKQIRKELNK